MANKYNGDHRPRRKFEQRCSYPRHEMGRLYEILTCHTWVPVDEEIFRMWDLPRRVDGKTDTGGEFRLTLVGFRSRNPHRHG